MTTYQSLGPLKPVPEAATQSRKLVRRLLLVASSIESSNWLDGVGEHTSSCNVREAESTPLCCPASATTNTLGHTPMYVTAADSRGER